jgi:hypothetical protein
VEVCEALLASTNKPLLRQLLTFLIIKSLASFSHMKTGGFMKSKNILLLSAFTLGSTAIANENRILKCTFTEPFYDITLDLDSGKLTQLDIDWENTEDGIEYIATVLDENSAVKITPITNGIAIKARSSLNNQVLVDAKLNYSGSDGMSDFSYPLEVIHMNAERGPQYGGCTLGKLAPYDTYQLEEINSDLYVFAQNASQAIGLCFNRAISDWTIAASSYDANSTKFSVLYGSEVVPGEPGNVSETFSSAENEALYESVLLTKTPPQDGFSTYQTRAAMWNYCELYGQFLQNRYIYQPTEE